jgi:hypothetical protein
VARAAWTTRAPTSLVERQARRRFRLTWSASSVITCEQCVGHVEDLLLVLDDQRMGTTVVVGDEALHFLVDTKRVSSL